MPHCHDLKEGDILICEECSLEVTVSKACDCSEGEESACSEAGFACYGMNLKQK